MTDTLLMSNIKAMNSVEAEKMNLAKASFVTVKKDRVCICCNKKIEAGSKAITASHMEDKRYGITLKELLICDYADESNFSFVPVRHWMCTSCAHKLVSSRSNKRCKTINSRHNTLEELYKKGEITTKEWDDIEIAEIHHYAFEEAVGIGQE